MDSSPKSFLDDIRRTFTSPLTQACRLYHICDFNGSILQLESLLTRTPCDSPCLIHLWLGRCRYALGDFSGALENFNQCVRLDSGRGSASTRLTPRFSKSEIFSFQKSENETSPDPDDDYVDSYSTAAAVAVSTSLAFRNQGYFEDAVRVLSSSFPRCSSSSLNFLNSAPPDRDPRLLFERARTFLWLGHLDSSELDLFVALLDLRLLIEGGPSRADGSGGGGGGGSGSGGGGGVGNVDGFGDGGGDYGRELEEERRRKEIAVVDFDESGVAGGAANPFGVGVGLHTGRVEAVLLRALAWVLLRRLRGASSLQREGESQHREQHSENEDPRHDELLRLAVRDYSQCMELLESQKEILEWQVESAPDTGDLDAAKSDSAISSMESRILFQEAMTRICRGVLFVRMGRSCRAVVDLSHGLDVLVEDPRLMATYPKQSKYLIRVARMCRGRVYMRMKKFQRAVRDLHACCEGYCEQDEQSGDGNQDRDRVGGLPNFSSSSSSSDLSFEGVRWEILLGGRSSGKSEQTDSYQPEIWNDLGMLYGIHLGKSMKAIECFSEAIRTFEDGVADLAERRSTESSVRMEGEEDTEAVVRDRARAVYFRNRGQIYLRLKDYERVIFDYTRSKELMGELPRSRANSEVVAKVSYYLGLAHFKVQHWEEARRALRECIYLWADRTYVDVDVQESKWKNRRRRKPLKSGVMYTARGKIRTLLAKAAFMLAKSCFEVKENIEAFEAISDAIHLNKDARKKKDFFRFRIEILLQLDRFDDALDDLQECESLVDPRRQDAPSERAELQRLGDRIMDEMHKFFLPFGQKYEIEEETSWSPAKKAALGWVALGVFAGVAAAVSFCFWKRRRR